MPLDIHTILHNTKVDDNTENIRERLDDFLLACACAVSLTDKAVVEDFQASLQREYDKLRALPYVDKIKKRMERIAAMSMGRVVMIESTTEEDSSDTPEECPRLEEVEKHKKSKDGTNKRRKLA